MFARIGIGIALVMFASGALGQYPTKPIRLIVGFAAGAVADSNARIVAQELSAGLGQPVIVENRAGADGAIAGDSVIKSAPDGYTLLFTPASAMLAVPTMRKDPPYDPVTDFTPIALVGGGTNVLLVHPSVPVRSARELVDYARANPGKLNFGTGNAISLAATQQLMRATGIQLVHVPYKGEAVALPDLLEGRVQLQVFATVAQAVPLAKEGRLRIVAALMDERSPLMPEVPTLDEAGIPGVTVRTWFALFGPRNLPRDVVMRLSREVNAMLKRPAARGQLEAQGVLPVPSTTPEGLAAMVKTQHEMWKRVAQESGLVQ